MNDNNTFALISSLQHYAFCPRQFALIYIEQAWAENRFTVEGEILHKRVDSEIYETRKGYRTERSVSLISYQYRLRGKMDLLEIEKHTKKNPHFYPVEYKRGRSKIEDWDRIQLCGQALCLEEMRNIEVTEGAIWYWQMRKREPIVIDQRLREATIAVIMGIHELILSGKTPKPRVPKSRCRACSLIDLCQPHAMRTDHSKHYCNEMFSLINHNMTNHNENNH